MTAPEEVPQEWTPWVKVVCARPSCKKEMMRQWTPGLPPPKYCDARCAKRESNRRNKISQNARKRAGEEIGQILTITITHCARPGCDRTGEREWHTAAEEPPEYCSTWCQRQMWRDRSEAKRQERDAAACEQPGKLAYMPTEQGVRKAATDAVRFAKYVYTCGCLRFHLTSEMEQGAPLPCVDHKRSADERRDAWYEYLLPKAQRLRERRAVRAARERS